MKELTITREFDIARSKLWKILTEPEHLAKWLFPWPESAAQVGSETTFSMQKPNGDTIELHCKVIDTKAPEEIRFLWSYPKMAVDTRVLIKLAEPDSERTIMTLTHENLDQFPESSTEFSVEGFREGWNFILGVSLNDHVKHVLGQA